MAKLCLGCYIVEKAKIRYSSGFLPLKMLEQGTAGELFYWKC